MEFKLFILKKTCAMKYFRTARGKPYRPSQPTSQNSCFLQFQFQKFLVTSTPISKPTVIKVEDCVRICVEVMHLMKKIVKKPVYQDILVNL